MKEILPRASRFARLHQARDDIAAQQAIVQQDDAAARTLRVSLQHIAVTDRNAIQSVFETAARNRIEAFNVKADALLVSNRRYIAELALEHRVPIMCADDRFTEAGALVSYGENFPTLYRKAAGLVHKILKEGAKPAELPVEEATPELVVNLSTAKRLGIAVPKTVLARADRVIT
jgi:putative ABC transport system substrate-binding protein